MAHIFQRFSDKGKEGGRGSHLSSPQYIAKPIVTAQDAIASHVRWKVTLLLAVRMREPLSERATLSIHRPQECSIHRWLMSKHTLRLRGTAEYRTALQLHLAFHVQMQRIALLLNTGQFEQAGRLLNSPESFQSTSNAFANALMALDRRTQAA
jgi:hypothetical protein